jgi:hypothetical protein
MLGVASSFSAYAANTSTKLRSVLFFRPIFSSSVLFFGGIFWVRRGCVFLFRWRGLRPVFLGTEGLRLPFPLARPQQVSQLLPEKV